MIYLLDVNLLIALLDPFHAQNASAHRWVQAQRTPLQWATCPLTENAFVRITGNLSYPNSLGSVTAAVELLRLNCASKTHHFWADEVSICQSNLWSEPFVLAPGQITDIYLLALAVKMGGRLATFDRKIPSHLTPGGREALVILPA